MIAPLTGDPGGVIVIVGVCKAVRDGISKERKEVAGNVVELICNGGDIDMRSMGDLGPRGHVGVEAEVATVNDRRKVRQEVEVIPSKKNSVVGGFEQVQCTDDLCRNQWGSRRMN